MSLINDAIDQLGEVFLTGFDGTTLSDDTTAFLSQAKVGGVLLFKRNYENLEQLVSLCNQIQECRTDLPLWISVDHEGGRVQRFKDPFTIIPPALKLAQQNSPKLVFDIAEVMGKELNAVGVNLNFVPVADILTNPESPMTSVIGDRVYGTTEEEVSKYVTAVVRGHLTMGVQPCVKHFPGHGDTFIDSHLELPTVDTDLDLLREREFKPFLKAFKSRCSMVMTAHILNKNLDTEFPATLSRKTIQGILREELRYQKIIFSDDLEMKAIADHYGAADAPRMALQAGCDILIYQTENAARHGYESVRKALESGALDAKRVLEAAARSRDLKRESLSDYAPADVHEAKKIVGCKEHKELVGRVK